MIPETINAELLASLIMVRDTAIENRGMDFNLSVAQWELVHRAIAKAEDAQFSAGNAFGIKKAQEIYTK